MRGPMSQTCLHLRSPEGSWRVRLDRIQISICGLSAYQATDLNLQIEICRILRLTTDCQRRQYYALSHGYM
jgi:hypothetical protein